MKAMGRLSVLLLLAAVVSSAALGDVGLARHRKLYAVPVPGPVVVDGRLDDWDLSGQIWMYVISETAEMQSAKFALMHDDQALYLSAEVRDPSPLMNRHDPRVDPDKGWDADSCQFRLILDPKQGYPVNQSTFNAVPNDQMCHMTLWYYTDRQEPVLQLSYGMTYDPPKTEYPTVGVVTPDRFQAKYLKAADGKGYTYEYRIPWSTLEAKTPPKAGDLVAGTVQFCWSAPDGLKTAGGSAWAYDVMNGPGFVYQSSACWGAVIFSGRGNLPKDLVEEGLPPEKPLPLTFSYEVPEDAEVSIALFDDKGYVARTLVASGARRAGENVERWDGLDNAGKPLAPGTYTWKGLYHQPIKTKFILSAHNSGQPPYKLDDGTGGWGADHGTPTSVAAAGDQMILTWNASESGWGIVKTDLTGKKQMGIRHNAEDVACDGERILVAGDYGFNGQESVVLFALKDGATLNWGNGKPYLAPPTGGDAQSNWAKGVAYGNGKVYVSWTDRDLVVRYDGKSGDLETAWAVEKPGRLAVRPDGTLAVLSAGKVLILQDGKQVAAITEHLDQPAGIAVGPDGTMYVGNRGALQNVSVFDKEGKYLRSIGKTGGRPRVGRYDPSGILEPGGMALDKNGFLWVAETLDSPKRVSVWDTRTGALAREFFGASAYFGWAYMDPKHPDELYCHNVLWKVNLDTGSCVPVSTIWRATAPNMIEAANPGGYAGHFRVMTAKNGKQFGWGMVDYSGTLFMRVGDIFKPIAGTIRVAYGPYGRGAIYPVMQDKNKYPGGAWMWQDKNDDQTVQEEELSPSPAGRGELTFNWVDEDLNVWCDAGWIYRPVGFGADGRPIYDFSKQEPIPFKGSNSNGTSLVLDNQDDTVYTLAPGGDPGWARWTRDGKLLWGYGGIVPWNRALSLPMVAPGKLWGLTMPLGVAGDFTGVACYFGPYHIFTRDGLYVAMVMRDGRSGGLGPDITASEVITGQLVKPEGMNRYFLLAGDQDGRVTEILGLDTVKRLAGGRYIHTEEAAKQAAEALADYQRALAKSKRLTIVRGRAALATAPAISKPVDAARSFTARAAYDERNLYVAYEVNSPYELTNEIPDPRLIFRGGNLLDIQIATDPAADPQRKTPAPGDVRLLVTRQGGKAVAVLYRPKVKGFTGEPVVLKSPTGEESFDSIQVAEVGLEYTKTGPGFRALVTVPLELLGWTPQAGEKVKMDLGYLFGNATGSQVALRAYWMNNSFSANVTNDVPNESRLEPAEWGSALVE